MSAKTPWASKYLNMGFPTPPSSSTRAAGEKNRPEKHISEAKIGMLDSDISRGDHIINWWRRKPIFFKYASGVYQW